MLSKSIACNKCKALTFQCYYLFIILFVKHRIYLFLFFSFGFLIVTDFRYHMNGNEMFLDGIILSGRQSMRSHIPFNLYTRRKIKTYHEETTNEKSHVRVYYVNLGAKKKNFLTIFVFYFHCSLLLSLQFRFSLILLNCVFLA